MSLAAGLAAVEHLCAKDVAATGRPAAAQVKSNVSCSVNNVGGNRMLIRVRQLKIDQLPRDPGDEP